MANMIPKLNLPQIDKNLPLINRNATPMNINIDSSITVEGVATNEIVKDMERVATKQAENVVAKINSMSYAKGVRRR